MILKQVLRINLKSDTKRMFSFKIVTDQNDRRLAKSQMCSPTPGRVGLGLRVSATATPPAHTEKTPGARGSRGMGRSALATQGARGRAARPGKAPSQHWGGTRRCKQATGNGKLTGSLEATVQAAGQRCGAAQIQELGPAAPCGPFPQPGCQVWPGDRVQPGRATRLCVQSHLSLSAGWKPNAMGGAWAATWNPRETVFGNS